MDYKSAIILQVDQKSSSDMQNNGAQKMCDYYAREGYHSYGGVDRSVTKDDVALANRLRAAKGMTDYYARAGRFTYRNAADHPLVAGEQSGGLWGRDGVIDTEKWVDELARSGSHVIRIVMSVRNENAKELGLDTKEGWQRAVRSCIDDMVRVWGIIEPHNVEWAAAYHVDGTCLHCHVMVIDKSGEWGRLGSPVVPRERFEEGLELTRKTLFAKVLEPMGKEMSFLRDWTHERIKADLGIRSSESRLTSLAEQARAHSIVLPRVNEDLPERRVTEAARAIVYRTLPHNDKRILQYSRSSKEVRTAARSMVEKLSSEDPALRMARNRFENLARQRAQALGHTGISIKDGHPVDREDEYVKDRTYDLNTRLANAGLTSLRELERNTHTHLEDHYIKQVKEIENREYPLQERATTNNIEHLPRDEAINQPKTKNTTEQETHCLPEKERTFPRSLLASIGEDLALFSMMLDERHLSDGSQQHSTRNDARHEINTHERLSDIRLSAR